MLKCWNVENYIYFLVKRRQGHFNIWTFQHFNIPESQHFNNLNLVRIKYLKMTAYKWKCWNVEMLKISPCWNVEMLKNTLAFLCNRGIHSSTFQHFKILWFSTFQHVEIFNISTFQPVKIPNLCHSRREARALGARSYLLKKTPK